MDLEASPSGKPIWISASHALDAMAEDKQQSLDMMRSS
jgi:hypothetical protein